MFNKADMLGVVNLYLGILAKYGIEPLNPEAASFYAFRETKRQPGRGFLIDLSPKLAYCGWMLLDMRKMAQSGDPGEQQKFFRWLPYVQGQLEAAEMLTVQEIRDHTRIFVK